MHCGELACKSGHGSFAESVHIYQSSDAVGGTLLKASSISIVPIDKNTPFCFCSLLRVKPRPGAVSVIC